MLRILQAMHALLPHQRRIASFWQFVDSEPPLFYESKKCYQPKWELIQEVSCSTRGSDWCLDEWKMTSWMWII